MKKIISIIAIAVLAVSVLAMTSCSKSEYSGFAADEKNITINAVNVDAGDYFITGTLEVEEGEQICIEPNLEKGEITVEFISSDGEDDIEEVPELDGEAVYTATVSGTDAQTVSFGAGSFMIKPTVTEKATGTIEIKVQPAN